MKKIAGIAATLAMATAFCGFCTGVAANVTANAETTSTPAVSTSAIGASPKVILNPGAFYNNSIETSAGSKVTKLTATEEAQYFVENAWFANYTAGEALPKATTTRSGVTFAGWRYAVDGETKVVTTMPTVTDDLYLYAHWSSGANPTPTPGPTPTPTPGGDDPTVTANQILIKFTDAKVVIEFTVPTWGTTGAYVYAWTGATTHLGAWPGTQISGNTVNIAASMASIEGIKLSFKEDSTDKETSNFKAQLTNGQVVKIATPGDGTSWSGNEFTPVITKTAF